MQAGRAEFACTRSDPQGSQKQLGNRCDKAVVPESFGFVGVRNGLERPAAAPLTGTLMARRSAPVQVAACPTWVDKTDCGCEVSASQKLFHQNIHHGAPKPRT